MASMEIEIKALVGDSEQADALRKKLAALGAVCQGTNAQINHYFIGGDLALLAKDPALVLDDEARMDLATIIRSGRDVSIRTRRDGDTVSFVCKASVDRDSSQNGNARIEVDASVSLAIEDLDAILVRAGYHYQAKWSRVRETYTLPGATITVDKNAGYGYVAEVERIVSHNEEYDIVLTELRALLQSLGLEELAQDRLERMFAFYNAHWEEYFGTDKTFVVL